jgi:MerR family redox-sensitive transcriptional activator SoxR
MEADDWHVSGLTVGQVAERTNIAPSAVRWYDDHGLLPSERTAGNQRRFSALPPRQVPTPEDWERLPGTCDSLPASG